MMRARWSGWRPSLLVSSLVAATGLLATVAVAIAARHAVLRPSDAVEAAIRAGWNGTAPGSVGWPGQDQTQRECTLYANRPPDHVAVAIMQREWRAIVYPTDGVAAGDWRRGEVLARDQTGNGRGRCTACHRLDRLDEAGRAQPTVESGSNGPPLVGYGVTRTHRTGGRSPILLYEQIFTSNAILACSTMPRFGVHNVLTPEEIRDIVAYLISPHSPLNAPASTGGSKDVLR